MAARLYLQPKTIDRMVYYYAKRERSLRWIADYFGLGRPTVYYHLQQRGVKMRPALPALVEGRKAAWVRIKARQAITVEQRARTATLQRERTARKRAATVALPEALARGTPGLARDSVST